MERGGEVEIEGRGGTRGAEVEPEGRGGTRGNRRTTSQHISTEQGSTTQREVSFPMQGRGLGSGVVSEQGATSHCFEIV